MVQPAEPEMSLLRFCYPMTKKVEPRCRYKAPHDLRRFLCIVKVLGCIDRTMSFPFLSNY